MKGLPVEGVHRSICQKLCLWWSEYQNTLLEDLKQKTKSFTNLHGNSLRSKKPETLNDEDLRTTCKNNNNWLPWRRHVINIERPSSPRSLRRRVIPSPTNESASSATTMSISELVAAGELNELDWDEATSMDSTESCTVCLIDNSKPHDISKSRTLRRVFAVERGAFNIGKTAKSAETSSPVEVTTIVSTVRMIGFLGTVRNRLAHL